VGALQAIGRRIAAHLARPRASGHVATSRPGLLAASLREGDVLLVEGTSRFSAAIRTLTQSTWSHAALYIGGALSASRGDATPLLIEADVNDGVRVVPVERYALMHTRICRPVGLRDDEVAMLLSYAIARLGQQYDLGNLVDLARYLVRPPPVPDRYRRRLLAFGGGEPTRAICSSLIAAAFASIRYPVLPDVEVLRARGDAGRDTLREVLHIRDSSLYVPRDFDVSPYFRIVKPTLEADFDPHALHWARPPRMPVDGAED
jgi:hypothetical protein